PPCDSPASPTRRSSDLASGDIPRLPLNLPLLKGCAVIGVSYGGFAEHEPARHLVLLTELLQWLAEGRIRPFITSRRPLEEAAAADRKSTRLNSSHQITP